jgi:hypothetical protein
MKPTARHHSLPLHQATIPAVWASGRRDSPLGCAVGSCEDKDSYWAIGDRALPVPRFVPRGETPMGCNGRT